MKLFRFVVISALVLFGLITLISLLLPADVKVSRAVVVEAPVDQLYMQIADLKNWSNWNPSFRQDTASKPAVSPVVTYSSPSYGKGAYCDLVLGMRHTHLQIIELDSTSVTFHAQLNGQDDVENTLSIIPVKESGNSQVVWKSLTHLRWYPWEKFYGIFADRITGWGYQQALEDLKNYVEKYKTAQ